MATRMELGDSTAMDRNRERELALALGALFIAAVFAFALFG